jgi:hypothetical protein
MNPIEILHQHYNKKKDKPREIGHYHASEIFSIQKGYTTTGNFFNGKPVDKQSQANMFRGSAMEDRYAKVLKDEKVKCLQQTRLEMKIADDVWISGKLDFDFKDFIVETKCPDKTTFGIPDKWCPQMEFYARASGKQVYLGIFYKDGEDIIKFYKYVPSETLWKKMQEDVINFHNRLVKKYMAK